MFKNLYYHKKTGTFFTIFFLIILPIWSFIMTGAFEFGFSLLSFIVFYFIPINIIVIFQKISIKKTSKKQEYEEKKKFYENNLGHQLMDALNECKTDADFNLWEKRNSKYFENVRDHVIREIEKKEKNLVNEILKIDNEVNILIASISEKKSSVQDLLIRHPFIEALIRRQNFKENLISSLPNKSKSRSQK